MKIWSFPDKVKEDLKTTSQKIASKAGDFAANVASTISDQGKLDQISKAANAINKTLFKNKVGRVDLKTPETKKIYNQKQQARQNLYSKQAKLDAETNNETFYGQLQSLVNDGKLSQDEAIKLASAK